MARIIKEIDGRCYRCDAETKWAITHVYVDYHGICHAFRCTRCNKTVPEFAWVNYQREGRIIIPV